MGPIIVENFGKDRNLGMVYFIPKYFNIREVLKITCFEDRVNLQSFQVVTIVDYGKRESQQAEEKYLILWEIIILELLIKVCQPRDIMLMNLF